MSEETYGAKIIARALHDLGVRVIFGLPGLPVIDIAQEGINLGIRFISFRNEQAAVYAACAYGYLTGRPGVCISVGGPGMLHIVAGIPHAKANAWPLLVLSGASETHNANKNAFQEIDAIPIIGPLAKLAVRPPYAENIPEFIRDGYRTAMFGRPGPSYIDLPSDLILGHYDVPRNKLTPFAEAPKCVAPENKVKEIVKALQGAKAPLVILGKGAAYARAEKQIRTLIDRTGLLFVPTPMGKGIVPDSSKYNVSAARSAALKGADVVLCLGARLNWLLAFGQPPKWSPTVKIIQVDICAEEIGKNAGDPNLSVVADIGLFVDQLLNHIQGWKWQGQKSEFYRAVQASKSKNEEKAKKAAANDKLPMSYEKCFDVIKTTLNSLSNAEDGEVVYTSEGANSMDISRSIFTMEHPRIRLDAGTYATMGVGLSYAIAAHAAYNFTNPEGVAGSKKRKKIVAIEGDSAFGLSGMEVETMARYKMDIITYVINNSGLYRGDSDTREGWEKRQKASVDGKTADEKGLSALSLGFETDYHKVAEYAGGLGFVVRTPDELKDATEKAFKADVPSVINVIIDPQTDLVMDFSWLDMAPKKDQERNIQDQKAKL